MLWCIAVALTVLLFATRASSQSDEARRTQASSDPASLKAAFLYNFALYATWPANQNPSFVLCAFGRDVLGPALEALSRRQIDGRAIEVRRIDSVADARGCQLLYVPEAAAASLASMAQALRSQAVLVVSDAAGAAEHAMIQIEPDGNRLAFSINVSRMRAAGLDASARLLRLARSVR